MVIVSYNGNLRAQTQGSSIIARLEQNANGEVEVIFTPNQSLSGIGNPLNIYLKIAQTEAAGTTINIVSNPFNISFINGFDFGGFHYYTYQGQPAVNLTSWTSNTDVSIATFQVTGSASQIFLSGGDFGTGVDIGSGTFIWPGTSILTNNTETNLVSWPISSFAALPITLLNFDVIKYGIGKVEIIWSTSTEINSSHFIVERSAELKNWISLGQITAAGFSSSQRDYRFIDDKLDNWLTNSFTTYYRLKMVDQDGSFEYSPIRPVTFEGQQMVEVFPNPTRQEATLRINSDTPEEAWVRIIGSHGKQVVEQRLSVSSGITEATIDCRHLPGGSYWIQVKGKTIDFCGKLILMKD